MASEHKAYPEHDKLAKVQERSQAIGEFLDWLTNGRGVFLAEPSEVAGAGLLPTRARITDLLAEYFEIDQDALEAEKRAILVALRGAA